ncbi:hypothetical protein PPL_00428 [Heterostelium album PN500]|uniref:N-acetyltransferase domain-containing protein n=1 Tax=Heterostelium pallidum (strain ATCC 26659 / Pp 5 / PN500) TaxID=670386 RepID=D3AWF4_HETP5|nr:hypothetical protein PPL_00428 [Heterostelium album PN500]EFA86627.1 hypothetical protein PPL_00428 [Heterostelium album PN500]|eukprot:XP_020438732.1 hypothetical protein PPL_00428 [Heterostelium album PN500]
MNQYDDYDSDGEDVPTLGGSTTSIINLRQFQLDFFLSISQKEDDLELDELIDDIRPKTHYERVEESIKQAILDIPNTPPNVSTPLTLENSSSPIMSSQSNTSTTSTTTTTTTTSTTTSNNNNVNNNNNNSNNVEDIDEDDILTNAEVIITFALYHPCKSLKVQEISVLGSQKLTDLKDKIYCLRDRILDGQNRKSSYFFINNIFYNDTRDPNNIKYSETILEWLRPKNKDIYYQEKNMQDEIFLNLSLSIGEKYLYCNQGNCEHFLIAKKIRLITVNDSQKRSDYPFVNYQLKVRRRKCKICEIYPSKFVTIGDKLVDETPYFFCEECYRMFHYTKEGALIYSDFKKTMNISIRRSHFDESEVMIDIWCRSVDSTHDFLTEIDRVEIEKQVRSFLPKAPLWVAVTLSDNKPMGFMLLSEEEKHMDALFVDPDFRGIGIGSLLVRHALSIAPELTTDVNEQNLHAVRFYKKMGFIKKTFVLEYSLPAMWSCDVAIEHYFIVILEIKLVRCNKEMFLSPTHELVSMYCPWALRTSVFYIRSGSGENLS